MEKLRHEEDCSVIRNDPYYADMAVLMDCDGNVVRRFPAAWTDEQIFLALRFANHACNEGFERGKREKAREIRTALEIV